MSHTPGPWRYRPLRDENGDEDGGVLFGENAVVADYLHLDNPDDACLIAAAPELYEALRDLFEAMVIPEEISIEAGFKARVRARDILLKLREEEEENA